MAPMPASAVVWDVNLDPVPMVRLRTVAPFRTPKKPDFHRQAGDLVAAAVEGAREGAAVQDVPRREGALADRDPGLARQVDVVEQEDGAGRVHPAVEAFQPLVDGLGEAEEFLPRRDAADGGIRVDGLGVAFLGDGDGDALPAAFDDDFAFARRRVLVLLVVAVNREDHGPVAVAVGHGRGHPLRGKDKPGRVGGDHDRLLGRVLGRHPADVGPVHGKDALHLFRLAGREKGRQGEGHHQFQCAFHIGNHFFLTRI